MRHIYAFDIILNAAIRVRAGSEAEARHLLEEHLDSVDCYAGEWRDGGPIVFEATMNEDPVLFEIDGESQ